MPLWAAATLSCITLFGLVLALRVSRRSAASRSGAERAFAIGMAVLSVGFFSRALRSTLAPHLSSEALLWFLGGARFIVAIGICILFVGAWKFYRRESTLSAAGAMLGTAVVFGSWASLTLYGGDSAANLYHRAQAIFVACQAMAFAWWGFESYFYHRRLRRQVALGLAEPIIADRFRLMAHAAFSLSAVIGAVLVCPWLFGQRPSQVPALLLLVAVVASYAMMNLYCALLSPAFYRRWLVSRLEKTAS